MPATVYLVPSAGNRFILSADKVVILREGFEEIDQRIAAYRYRGDSVPYVPEEDVFGGDVIVQGGLVGIAKIDIPAGTLGVLHLRGVYEIDKAGVAIGFGAFMYWDEVAKKVTSDPAGGANPYLGKSVQEAGAGAPTVRVRIQQ